MAELTNLETKLGEVIGLAMAAQAATERVEKLTKDAKLRKQLKTMRQEAAKAEKDGTAVAGELQRQEEQDPRRGPDGEDQGRDDDEDLPRARLRRPGRLRVPDDGRGRRGRPLGRAAGAEQAGRHPGVRELVKVQLPIQKRHLKDVLAASLQLAAKEDANAAA